jgi:RNA-binding protein
MALTPKVRQQLKGKAHKLKPVVMLGNQGLTDAVKKEIDRALNDHELIKIKIQSQDRDDRRAAFAEICESLQCEMVQQIGSVGVVYRKLAG